MGQAKIKQRAAFASQLVDEWEADDCVNFAIALARLTGWLLHVDWWSTSTEDREGIVDDTADHADILFQRNVRFPVHDHSPVARAELPGTVASTAQRKQSGVADGRQGASGQSTRSP